MSTATATAGGQHWASALHPWHALHPLLHHLSPCSSMGPHVGISCLAVSMEGNSLSKPGPSCIVLLLSPLATQPHKGYSCIQAPVWWQPGCPVRSSAETTGPLPSSKSAPDLCFTVRNPCHQPPPQLPWNLVGHNAGGCKIKQPRHLTASSGWFALLVYCEANWRLAMMYIKFQNSVWVCIEIQKIKKGRKEGMKSQSMATASFFFLPLNPCWHNAEYCQRFLFYFSNQ